MILKNNPLFWSVLANLLRFGYSLILMPIVLIFFQPEEVTLWLSFIMLASAIPIFDMGIAHTLKRTSAYVYAGAKSFNKKDIPQAESDIQLNILSSLIKGSRKMYIILTFIAAFALYFFGSIYIQSISADYEKTYNAILWVIYITGFLINFYFSHMVAIMFGRGDIIDASKVNIIFGISYLVIAIVSISLGFTLVGICFSVIIASFISRFYAYKKFNQCRNIKSAVKIPITKKQTNNFINKIKLNAFHYGLVALSVFMISRVPTLMIVYFFGREDSSNFTFTLFVFSLISVLTMLPFTISMPTMNKKTIKYGVKKIKTLFQLSLFTVLISSLLASLILIFFGPIILKYLGSSVQLISLPYIIIIALTGILEANHAVCANILTVQNRVPFYKQSLATGILIIIFTIFAFKYNVSIEKMVIIPFIVQLGFNNWYWPLQASSMLKENYFSLLKNSFRISYRFIRTKC